MTPVGGTPSALATSPITTANIVLLTRSAAGSDNRLPNLARSCFDARVDIIVAEGVVAALAAKAATRTVPIVMAITGDPIGLGSSQAWRDPAAI